MSDKRYAVMFFRLGLLASVIFAVFWGIWQFAGRQVPSYTDLKFTENILWTFPFSRWWDIPSAFLMVNLYAWILRIYYKFSLKFASKEDIAFGLVVGLAFGLVVGLAFGLVVGLAFGLVVGLAFGLCLLIIKVLFSCNFYKSIYNWFVAKNIA